MVEGTARRDVDLANSLAISRATVWRWVREGRLPPPVKIGPNTTRWLAEDLEQFWRECRSLRGPAEIQPRACSPGERR
ncbi:MAG: AlpA family phage regulatory protein [Thermoanaerobaculia bacterium]|nr:AlpA family phage regulatory protein [Thermoanaerobaculia bacterium]